MADRVGQQLGNYRLLRLLGEGGFAQVYLGKHIHLGTLAAIKLLSAKLDAEEVERFREEARTIARLRHPQIVRVLEFGVEGGTPFLVMDYAAGGTLRQRHPKGAQLPPETIVPYVQQVASALQYAHDLRLIHRDVKPENMLLGEREEVLLSDFGIALVAQSSRYQSTQDTAGTIAYMAPEQIQGHPRPASDQYSLGIVVYEWLTGERPFTGSMSEVVAQHLGLPPPPLRERLPYLPPALEQVVLTALEKDSKARFASVQEFASALERACRMAPPLRPSVPLTTVPEPPAPSGPVQSADQPEPSWQFAPTRRTPPRPADASTLRQTPPASPFAPTVPAAAPPVFPATPTKTRVPSSGPLTLPPTFSDSRRGPAAPPAPLPAQPRTKTPRSKWLLVGVLGLVLVLVLGGVGLGFAGKGPLASLGTTPKGATPTATMIPTATPRPALGTVQEFAVPTANSNLSGITAGPDGNLWFTEANSNKIGRITPEGSITEFALPAGSGPNGSGPNGITAGPDGNLWFTEVGSPRIGRITPAGQVTEFALPNANSTPRGITVGPDGNLWFAEDQIGKVGRITPEGRITEFVVPNGNPTGITAGPDGNLWFAEGNGGDKVGRITPGGSITEFPLPNPNSYPSEITTGPDGNLWFTEGTFDGNNFTGSKIGRITPGGSITEFPLPTANSYLASITTGPDGNLWFTEYSLSQSGYYIGSKVGRITPEGSITEFPLPNPNSAPGDITAGPDGNLWFTEAGNQIGRISPGP